MSFVTTYSQFGRGRIEENVEVKRRKDAILLMHFASSLYCITKILLFYEILKLIALGILCRKTSFSIY